MPSSKNRGPVTVRTFHQPTGCHRTIRLMSPTAPRSRGTSSASAASAAVIVGTPGPPPKPTIVKTAAGSLKVSFTAPAANGAAITSYTATCTSSNGGVTRSKSAASSPITVTTLSAGKTYTCTVRATNSRGAGPLSPPSSPAIA